MYTFYGNNSFHLCWPPSTAWSFALGPAFLFERVKYFEIILLANWTELNWTQQRSPGCGSLRTPDRRKPQRAHLNSLFIWLHHISGGFSDCFPVSYNTCQLYLKMKLNVNPLRNVLLKPFVSVLIKSPTVGKFEQNSQKKRQCLS